MPSCSHCGADASAPKTCARCRQSVYCSRACQIAAWKSGHKAECKKFVAATTGAAKEVESSTTTIAAPADACFKTASVEKYDGGIGCFATRDIRKGEVVLIERPVVVAKDVGGGIGRGAADASKAGAEARLDAAVAALSEADRAKVFALTDVHSSGGGGGGGGGGSSEATALGIFRTNAYPTAGGEGGLFPLFARFNHACTPNVSHRWCPADSVPADGGPGAGGGVRAVFAARDIAAGEELLNSYIEPAAPRHERRAALRAQFGFDCTCAACALGDDAATLRESDRRRARAGALDDEIFGHIRSGRYAPALAAVEERLALLEAEGLAAPAVRVRVCYDAYQACAHRDGGGGGADAGAWLRRVLKNTELSDLPGSSNLAELRGAVASFAKR